METERDFLPCKPIYDLLARTQGERGEGCKHLDECAKCFGARRSDLWHPEGGRVPRSFAGALRSVAEVRLVIVLAEPSKPEEENGQVREPFESGASGDDKLAQAAWYSFSKLMDPSRYGGTEYHRNLGRFIEDCFRQDDGPGLPFREQLARTWIAASVFCSIPTKAIDKVPDQVVVRCAENYLLRELSLFTQRRPVLLAMGKNKAAQRLRLLGIEGFVETWHPGKPAAIRRHKEGERTPCLTCVLRSTAEQVREQLKNGATWRVRPGSIAARAFERGASK